MDIFRYFLLTLIIELPIVLLFYRKQVLKVLLIALLANAFTWPLLQLTTDFIDDSWVPFLEIMIAIIEGGLFYIFLGGKFSYAILTGFFANGMSYGLGFLIT